MRIRSCFPAGHLFPVLALLLAFAHAGATERIATGIKGDPSAIADAKAMVETMGGQAIWSRLEAVHFVHEWDVVSRPDRYVEDEILDLTGPRSWVKMESETSKRIRAYSPEHRYWSITDGDFEYGSDESLSRAMERAPYSIYRLARAIARDDSDVEVRYGHVEGIPAYPALEFVGPDGEPRGWIVINARKEPIIWATTQYVYVFGPLRRFGNLRVPDWATTSNGLVRYEMISLTGSNERPALSLFEPPD